MKVENAKKVEEWHAEDADLADESRYLADIYNACYFERSEESIFKQGVGFRGWGMKNIKM